MKFGSSPSKGLCINIKEHTKLGSAGTPPPWGRRLADPLKIKPTPHMCYHIKFGSSAAKGVCINRMESKKLRSAGTPPSCGRGVYVAGPLEIRTFPACVILPSFVVLRQWYRRYSGDPPENWILRVPPFKVTQATRIDPPPMNSY